MAAKQKFSSTAKAAAVMIALGADEAAQVYKFLREDEVEKLSLEIAKLDRMSPEGMQEIVDDFYGLCVTQKVIAEGGIAYARDILEKAFGPQQAQSYLSRVSKSLRTKAFDFIRKTDYKNLLMMLRSEHPQTIALVLSYARSDQASQVMAELPKNLQIEVIERIANLQSVQPDIIAIVEGVLEKQFANIISVDMTEVGGVPYIADIMNHVDRNTEKYIFDELNNNNPELSEEIRKLMFVFEDIVNLDNLAIQRFIREVDSRDLAVALKASADDVRNAIFGNMSKRMQETIQSDIQYLHNVRMRDVEEAQQRIVATIRQLEEMGEIVISKGGEDEIIA